MFDVKKQFTNENKKITNSIGIKLKPIPAGTFLAGPSDNAGSSGFTVSKNSRLMTVLEHA